MPEIKRIFDEKYRNCDIKKISKYKIEKYRLGGISKPIVYSVDCLFDKHPEMGGYRCDEFIFFDVDHFTAGIYLIELKTNSQNVERVRQQLDGGARFIEHFLDNDPATEGESLDFMPFWVSKGLKNSTSKKLRKVKVSMCNRSKHITHVQNNKTLPKLK